MSNLELGATFSSGSSSPHSFQTWGLFMGPPGYDFGAEKTHIVTLPYSDEVLDFSNIYGQRFFEESTFTYEFVGEEADYEKAMTKIKTVHNFFNNFRGSVTDDVISPKKLTSARCTGFSFDINPSGFFKITVKLTGLYK